MANRGPSVRVRGVARSCTCARRRPHGTAHTYTEHHCGCEPCREGNRARRARLALARSMGAGTLVDRTPARDWIALYRQRGGKIAELIKLTGIPRTTLRNIAAPGEGTMYRGTRDLILSVPLPTPRDERECRRPGCHRPLKYARLGLCELHYSREHRHVR